MVVKSSSCLTVVMGIHALLIRDYRLPRMMREILAKALIRSSWSQVRAGILMSLLSGKYLSKPLKDKDVLSSELKS